MHQRYTRISLAPELTHVSNPDVREYALKLPKWLNRPIRWLWERMSSIPLVTAYKQVTVEHERLLELIYAEKANMMRIYHGRAQHVVVGQRQFCDLFGEIDAQAKVGFCIDAELNGPAGLKVANLHVHVVPWFDGVLVLPPEIK